MQKEKYAVNNMWIEQLKDMQIVYPNLLKLAKKHLNVLQKINDIGVANIATIEESVDRQAVFFTSTDYIADFISCNKSNICRSVNLLATLGLIRKVQEKDIPAHMLERARENVGAKKINLISFYTVPNFNKQLFLRAEEIATELINNKINAQKITCSSIEEVFGMEFANNIFGNNKERTKAIEKKKVSKIENITLSVEENEIMF